MIAVICTTLAMTTVAPEPVNRAERDSLTVIATNGTEQTMTDVAPPQVDSSTPPHIFFGSDDESPVDLTALADNPCPVRSSITGRGCLLPAGHPPHRPDRFHRYRKERSDD